MWGKIVYILKGTYKLIYKGELFNAKIKGSLKKKYKLIIGDIVLFSFLNDGEVLISDIKKRRNEFERPKVANVSSCKFTLLNR